MSAAEMEARQELLAAKQEALEEVFSIARQKLMSLPEEEFVELLAAFAAREGESGREELLFSEEMRARIGEKVVARANAIREGAAMARPELDRAREKHGPAHRWERELEPCGYWDSRGGAYGKGGFHDFEKDWNDFMGKMGRPGDWDKKA